MSAFLRGAWQALLLLLALASLSPTPVNAAFINFENCLNTGILDSDPLQLQFIPLFFDAKFNRSAPGYPLNITVYGNVSGQQVEGVYPPPDSPQWQNPNETFGKIANVGSGDKYSTLLANFKVLTYEAYNAKATEFCGTVLNATCPLGPDFTANASVPSDLPAFALGHEFGSSYAFSTLASTVRIISGDRGGPDLACVSASITPDLGPSITGLLTWLPAAILVLKGVATLSAAIWSPWGSSDIFRWSSNYGRDEDQLRLVTPGFGDCLQYIQFITLTGALSLQYPGFYQPAVSQTSWSLLLFNESFVSHGNGTQSLVDGVYMYNGTYGMTAMSQLIGMSSVEDIWACMAVWLLVIAVVVVLLCQLGFFARWIYRTVTDTTEEDLRQKNLPFTLGNMIRLLFNYFILPIVALSLFQLVISGRAPTSVVVMAVILVVIMIVSAGWILRVIFTTKPRTILFDDMPTVLLYGPLYNTYSDSAAPFALVPVFITFVRGVALGAIQPSGIAQIIVLAICEVILILTLNGFRPFQNQTSMNAYHTFFAIARLITVLLFIAFVPTLGVSEAPKGWIGYAILLIHACVLVFGFFLNAAQTLIEVIARSMGVAGDAQTGAIRGSILNMRMLKKRQDRSNNDHRGSMTSNAAILQDSDGRSAYAGGRSRSMSASSQQLLNQIGSGGAPSVHRLSAFENFSSGGDLINSPGLDSENAQAGFTYPPNTNGSGTRPALGIKTDPERAETFYRPPRPRRITDPLEPLTPAGTKTRKSGASVDFPYQDSPELTSPGHARQSSYEAGFLGRESPAPAYFRDRADSNENLPRTDYAVREVDQYYRGAALSGQPTRKLKTGPADPEGPAASAQTWLQKLRFGVQGRKQKEPSKGFEVVRSSRMPKDFQKGDLDVNDALEMQTSPAMHPEPYRDSPPMGYEEAQTDGGAERAVSPIEADEHRPSKTFQFGFDGTNDLPDGQNHFRPDSEAVVQPVMRPSHETATSGPAEQPRDRSFDMDSRSKPSMDTESNYDRPPSEYPDEESSYQYRTSEVPSLGPIESFGGLDLPSRFSSRRSANMDSTDNGDTRGGQDWLRAVDSLERNHPRSAQSSQRQSSGGNASQRSPPYVPRRSSRRTPSQDVTPRGLSAERSQHGDVFAGFDSGHPSPDLVRRDGFLGATANNDRPSSYASVSHHRAGDSISRNSFGADAALHGTSAEIFSKTPPGSNDGSSYGR